MNTFDLSPQKRKQLLNFVSQKLEHYYVHSRDFPVSPSLEKQAILEYVQQFDFSQTRQDSSAIEIVMNGLERYAVHTPHPAYFGLFNPRTNFASVLADLIMAGYNPQMAAWSHSPYAAEIEQHLIREFGIRFGYPKDEIDGVFATGGAEANLTALLCALNEHFPEYAQTGLRGLDAQPVLYGSAQSHHSIIKAARAAGLGSDAVRNIAVHSDLRMDMEALKECIVQDIQKGYRPFMVVGTAGTTGAGSIDDLAAIAAICQQYNLWFHTDAAYGGAVVLHPEYKTVLKGIEQSDSITFDVHKWLSVSMGASMFICRNPHILSQSFRIETAYMPNEAKRMPITDPFTHSIQWSRRFIGLKLYLTLLLYGWEGCEEMVEGQIQSSRYLQALLVENGWQIRNQSPLPILCFTDPRFAEDPNFVPFICDHVVQSGKAWISVYPIGEIPCLRACLTNYATEASDMQQLVQALHSARLVYQNNIH